MKKTNFIKSILLASIVSLSACNNDTEETLSEECEIKLTNEITPTSRVTSLEYQSTQIVQGQEVGVTIANTKSTHNNVAWTAGPDGTLTNTGETVYYGNQAATITAYHPYNAAWTGTSHVFSVNTDQSTDNGYLSSDLLWATEESTKTESPVALTFTHKLAKINVTLRSEDIQDLSDATISICGTNIDTYFDPTTGTLSPAATANVQDIKAGVTTTGAYTASAIVVPQTASSGTKLIKVSLGSKTFYYTLTAEKLLKAGYSHNYTLTVKEKEIELKLKSENITNWENEEMVEGVADEYDIRLFTSQTISIEPIQDSNGVYLIESADNLKWFMENGGKTNYKTASYKLMTDIIFDDFSWKPFHFSGVFDGGNHIIKNLDPNGYSLGHYGFFATSSGIVKNLIFLNPKINQTGDNDYYGVLSGVLTASASGSIINCGVIGGNITINSTSRAKAYGGGLIGRIDDDNTIVKGCYVKDTKISGNSWNTTYVGGLIGCTGKSSVEAITITSCYTKDLTISGGTYNGTFIASTYYCDTYSTPSTISTCYYDGSGNAIGHTNNNYQITTNIFEALTETNFESAINSMNTNLTDCDYKFDTNGLFIPQQ